MSEEELREYVASELCEAASAAIHAGATADAVAADLDERLRRVNHMLAALENPAGAGDGRRC